MTKEEERGYTSAKDNISKGSDVQELYNESIGAIDNDSPYDKGWQKACIEAGAVDNY